MKTHHSSFFGSSTVGLTGLVLFLIFSLPACSSSNHLAKNETESEMEEISGQSNINNVSRNMDLTAHIRKLPGVRVSGDGSNAVVKVLNGNANSFTSDDSPLFVLDGNILNVEYNQLYSMVNSYKISSVKVLKGAEAGIYGYRGGNGVIEITSTMAD